jgi:hypothetical protein
MSDKCDNGKCKEKKVEDLYHRSQYGGGPVKGGWFCLKCYEAQFGEFGKKIAVVESGPETEVETEETLLEKESSQDILEVQEA